MDALAFLDRAPKSTPQPVYVLPGDEGFLKRQALTALQTLLLEDADPAFAWTSIPGDTADWKTIRGELDTMPFLSPRRVVVIEMADKFVTDHRPTLEKYVAKPATSGVLILEVKSWPSNTKLAKLVPDAGTIVCKSPPPAKVVSWCATWARQQYDRKLGGDAAAWLVELVGPDMGLLDQELGKLAVYAGNVSEISREDVDLLVGRSRAAETFKIFDAIGNNRPADALAILHRLFDQNEAPLAILGAFSWQLRRLVHVGRAVEKGKSIAAAIDAAGVPPFARAGIEQQLRHLGRRRIAQLCDWLLEADLAMKSTGALPEKLVLERLVVRLARPRAG